MMNEKFQNKSVNNFFNFHKINLDMNIILRIISILFLLTNISCNHFKAKREITDIVNNNIGREIRFPVSLHPINNVAIDKLWKNNNINMKLVVYTDGDCGVCIAELAKWNQYLKTNKSLFNEIDKIFIVYSNNYTFFEYNIEKAGITLPFVYDSLNQFIYENRLDEPLLHTLILNQDNTILLIGSPLENQAMQEIYKRVLGRI